VHNSNVMQIPQIISQQIFFHMDQWIKERTTKEQQ